NLDDPAYKYFPKLKNKKVGVVKDGNVIYVPADKLITLRHLISHSSGIGSSWNAGALQSIYPKIFISFLLLMTVIRSFFLQTLTGIDSCMHNC
ncbi:MAG TPA: hypothetical protein VF700_13310, partial [Segetibacter sp.]